MRGAIFSRFHSGTRESSFRAIVRRIWRATLASDLFDHAAELGFYFLFALFPTLFCASSALGLVARSAQHGYSDLLHYLSLVLPTAAFRAVLHTFNETALAASSGKITFGSIASVWSASVGISALQDTLNDVNKLTETRSYFVARLYAIGLTIILTITGTLTLASMFAGDFMAAFATRGLHDPGAAKTAAILARVTGWVVATFLLLFSFSIIYAWAPDWKRRRWRWFTPGTAFGVFGWLLASLGFRVYLHFFNSYTLTYGSLGAVIILLIWFYISGLMLLLGAEIDSQLCTSEDGSVRPKWLITNPDF
jgi:membrane protein